MSTRRAFIKQASLLTPAAMLLPDFLFAEKKIRSVGIQLYTLRELVAKDPRATLQQVASAGYKEVELYGFGGGKFFGIPVAEFASFMSSLGLSVPSGHYMPAKFLFSDEEAGKAELDEHIQAAITMKSSYLTIPWLPPEKRSNLEDYKKIAAKLNIAGEACKKAGIQLAYHNHDFEFANHGGQTGFDLMTSTTDADLVKWELDLYWVVFAGLDPVQIFSNLKGRIPMWHVKDMNKANRAQNTEIGNGSIDWKRIFKAAKTSGLKHFFVEQENNYVPDHLKSVESSIRYIKNNLI
ncbi:sugar phosphate isomerase/epimerase family protein [Flavihumibacter sp. UBA7668]|uniref:sugar phosphate isomerase/epimerase family protein n=1 Tax=Flavihumibacter sp. UBA7668 TaxID=1946542 RepID=UPI0025B8FD51|nr:sugar phosphate isomerase/epimerase [Flavihumibacter sp. UBA7668]